MTPSLLPLLRDLFTDAGLSQPSDEILVALATLIDALAQPEDEG